MIHVRLNLAVDGVSEVIEITNRTIMTVHLQAASTWTGTARLKLSLTRRRGRDGEDLESWIDFDPAVEFSVSAGLLIRAIPVYGIEAIRLETETIDSAVGTVNAVVSLS